MWRHFTLSILIRAKFVCSVCLFLCWQHAIAPAVRQRLTQPATPLLAAGHIARMWPSFGLASADRRLRNMSLREYSSHGEIMLAWKMPQQWIHARQNRAICGIHTEREARLTCTLRLFRNLEVYSVSRYQRFHFQWFSVNTMFIPKM